MDGIELEILWSNLIGIVSEQAKALQRIAFSPIVREAGDLASGLFDAQGRMVAQANTGTPGHINSLAAAGKTLAGLFHNQLVPGDVIITNDPWMSAGHFFDIRLSQSPDFPRRAACLAAIGSTVHHTPDIGGLRHWGRGARTSTSRRACGLSPSKFYEAGVPNALLHDIIRHNVRTPDHVFGDLSAQVSSTAAQCGRRPIAALQANRHGRHRGPVRGDHLPPSRRRPTRRAIRALPAGTLGMARAASMRPWRRHHRAQGRGDRRTTSPARSPTDFTGTAAPARWGSMW